MSVNNKNAHDLPKATQTSFCDKPMPLKSFLLAVKLLLLSLLSAPLMATDFVNPGPVVTQVNQFADHKIENVYSTVQDNAGFLWLGTMNGLLRYDGYDIKGFYHDINNPGGLNNNDVKKLLLDENNLIWLFTPAGLSRFNPATEQFTHFKHESSDAATIDSPSINTIALGDNNKLWIGTTKGINLFDRVTQVNQRLNSQFTVNDNSNPQNIHRIFQDKQQRIWYALRNQGLSMYDPASKTTSQYLDSKKLNAYMVASIFQSRDGLVWIGSTLGVSRYQPNTNDFAHYKIPLNVKNSGNQVSVKSIYEDNEGRLWIGSYYNSLSVLLPSAKSVVNLNQTLSGTDIMDARHINDIYQDRSATLWIGSAYGGVYKLNANALAFEHHFANLQQALKINTLYKDAQGDVWLGSSKNLYRYHAGSNQNNGQFKLEKADIGFISSISGYQDNTLMIAVSNKTLLSYDTSSKQFSPFAVNGWGDSILPSNAILSMATTGQDLLWMGVINTDVKNAGLFSFDRQTNRLTHHLNSFVIEAILPLGQHILIGTKRNGLHLYDLASKSARRVETKGQDGNRIWSLYQDSKSRIWVGTNAAGLAQLDMTSLTLSFPLPPRKITSNMITAITEDKQGDLWLGTSKGISKYSPKNGEVRTYDHQDGLRLSSISPKLATVLPNGQILMANAEQTVKFSPTRLNTMAEQSIQSFPVLLSDFKLFNTPVARQNQNPLSPLTNTINQSERLTLSHEQYWFSLAFSSSDYKNLAGIRYAYKLEGLSDKWLETDNSNRIAVFTSLPAKDYQLQIKTSTPNGGWSDTVRTLDITITPPWWLTWQAYLLYAFFIIGGSITFYRVRIRSLVNRANALELGVKERTATINTLLAQKERMFANISHEFKTPLTLILSPLESINDKTSNTDVTRKVSMMKRNGQRLLRMVEQLLELSRLETLDTGVRHNYSMKESLELLLTSFQPLLDVKNLKMDATELEDAIVSLKADALEMILTNLISNAIKYTKDNGNITITVRVQDKNVVLSVIDTGIGISPDNIQLVFKRFTRANEEHDENIPGAGIGLALVKELVENDKGTINLASEIGKGSTFTVTFPVSTTQGETVQAIAGLSSTSQNEIDALIQNKELNQSKSNQSNELSETPVDNPDKPTLLLIDDNADMLTLLTDTLENRYQCITAKNGELGLEQAQSQIPDLIICDVMMPGISGYEVAKQLKLNELTCHIPVVLLTAKGDMDSRMEGWKQDIDDYLPKPFHPKELHLRIHSLLSIRHLLKKRFNKEVAAAEAAPAQIAEPIEVVMSDKDRQFIIRFKKVIVDNFAEPEFSREQAAESMMISDRQLHRKLSALIEDTFTEYLRSYRLDKAVDMLTTGLQIGQISDQVGFTSMAYFSKCFKAQFNKTPKQYQKELTH